jgi:hypothetical protein
MPNIASDCQRADQCTAVTSQVEDAGGAQLQLAALTVAQLYTVIGHGHSFALHIISFSCSEIVLFFVNKLRIRSRKCRPAEWLS